MEISLWWRGKSDQRQGTLKQKCCQLKPWWQRVQYLGLPKGSSGGQQSRISEWWQGLKGDKMLVRGQGEPGICTIITEKCVWSTFRSLWLWAVGFWKLLPRNFKGTNICWFCQWLIRVSLVILTKIWALFCYIMCKTQFGKGRAHNIVYGCILGEEDICNPLGLNR